MTMNIIYINKLFRKYQYKNTMKSEYICGWNVTIQQNDNKVFH